MSLRERISLLLEIALWVAVLVLLGYLIVDIGAELRATRTIRWQSVIMFVVLGLLVWWPIIRTRIRHGYWIESWNDSPESRGLDIQKPPKPPRKTIDADTSPRR